MIAKPPWETWATRIGLVAICACAGLLAATSRGSEEEDFTNQIKAQYVFNFAQFIEWPSSKFLRPDSPLIIGVIGSAQLESQLDEVVKRARINDRPVMVQNIGNNAELKRCHILFISSSQRERFAAILGQARGEHVLTIGEGDRFLSRGGIVNFLENGSSVLFQINLGAARHAGLKISSKLLQLRMAQVVDSEGQPIRPDSL